MTGRTTSISPAIPIVVAARPAAAGDEVVFYDADDVFVSDKRIVVGSTTYQAAGVISVRAVSDQVGLPSNPRVAAALMTAAVGIIGLAFGIASAVSTPSDAWKLAVMATIPAALLAWCAVAELRKKESWRYGVLLTTSAGEFVACWSKDAAAVNEVTAAIARAFTLRA